jgi:hypothetical protein
MSRALNPSLVHSLLPLRHDAGVVGCAWCFVVCLWRSDAAFLIVCRIVVVRERRVSSVTKSQSVRAYNINKSGD